jgi:ankyrin repeat protein
MSALVAAASRGDVAKVRWLLKRGASLGESDVNGRTAMCMAVYKGHTLVVKCLIKEDGADIEAMITAGHLKHSVLERAVRHGNYSLVQWLIEEGALIPVDIWWFLKYSVNVEVADAAELSSLLNVLTLLPMSSE